ncbi:MAG: class I mannose-6-phosphate isomerase [bacterium]|nr:class I mannose-6-phosphate isomerase [Candidatus Kapabacteria bacterium]
MYPSFRIASGSVDVGYDALARAIVDAVTASSSTSVTIDGYGGVMWETVRQHLHAHLLSLGYSPNWIAVRQALRTPEEIDRIVEPHLGGDDPLWGTAFNGDLIDFFDTSALAQLLPDASASINIVYGEGAALAEWNGQVVYLDVPKNEIQFRSRAGSITAIGAREAGPAKKMYKRFYFVDWPVLSRHKASLLPRIAIAVDAQRVGDPVFMRGETLRASLSAMARTCFRPRPWFEPGPWGGQWIKHTITQLPQDVPNYAWSFELIAPENGIMIESDGVLFECSLDTLMFQESPSVLGRASERFGAEFPIRFDFLDTFDGGNLSVQCHPRTEYIQREFGERFTQDETYYILDCKPGAEVYLGFNEGIDAAAFRGALERSRDAGSEVDVRQFVNTVAAHRHDLFLIPNGTIHCSGRDNLVLEISATPYIFTFKMYDWLRRDLDGNLRPINIERAFDNLDFARTASVVESELISRPVVVGEGSDWRIVHLPTHREHFYDVRRVEFDTTVEIDTDNDCHVMSLVEGLSIILENADGSQHRFNYAETFVVPAAAGRYRMINEGSERAMVIQSWVKHDHVGATHST